MKEIANKFLKNKRKTKTQMWGWETGDERTSMFVILEGEEVRMRGQQLERDIDSERQGSQAGVWDDSSFVVVRSLVVIIGEHGMLVVAIFLGSDWVVDWGVRVCNGVSAGGMEGEVGEEVGGRGIQISGPGISEGDGGKKKGGQEEEERRSHESRKSVKTSSVGVFL